MKRFWQVDFLRGVAIVLVLLRHCDLSTFTNNIGWIGVDLFFVLSGFLITNLLLEEYKNNLKINLKYFLIRRALKIYPLYYLVLFCYVIYTILHHKFQWDYFLAEFFFFQNYKIGWGWSMYGGSWSLAIEEHFYFSTILVTMFVFFLMRKNNRMYNMLCVHKFNILFFIITLVCLSRVAYFFLSSVPSNKQFTMTHLRIDTILWGVLFAMAYHFKNNQLKCFFKKFYLPLLIFSLVTIFSFGFLNDIDTFFVRTIGFSLLGFSFFILLGLCICFKLEFLKQSKLNKLFIIIGLASYSIYITHPYLIQLRYALESRFLFVKEKELLISFASFFIYLIIGYLVYFYIERKILRFKLKFKISDS